MRTYYFIGEIRVQAVVSVEAESEDQAIDIIDPDFGISTKNYKALISEKRSDKPFFIWGDQPPSPIPPIL